MSSLGTEFRRIARESGWVWACSLAADRIGVPGVVGLWPDRPTPAARLQEQVAALLTTWGAERDAAEAAAGRILYADLRGIDSHGVAMLPFYHERVRAGQLVMNPRIEVVQDGPGTAVVDGGGGLGHLAGAFAMQVAIEKARETGVGAVGVRNSSHFGAAGAYAADALAHGMLGIATTGTPTSTVLPTHGAKPVLGTNPLAFAAPGNPPFLLDMATSTVSRGKLLERWRRGRSIPSRWAVDTDGRPATNGRVAFHEGRLTPLGSDVEGASHKGYGLAVMVEILSNLLPGVSKPPLGSGQGDDPVGHFFLALDPERFLPPGAFPAEVDNLLGALRRSPAMDPKKPVQVAGDPEAAILETRTRDGIPLSRAVFENLRHVALASGTAFGLE